MKVIMLYSKEFEPNPVLYRQCQTLLKNGHNVKIIAWDRTNKRPKNENIDGIEVQNVGVKCSYGDLAQLLVKIFSYYSQVFRMVIKEKFDVMHCHDIQTIPIGLFIGKLLGKKVIYDVHDFYFDRESLLNNMLKAIDSFFASKADFITVPSDYFSKYYMRINNNVSVIFNVPEKDLFVPIKTSPKKSVFTISYFGSVRWDKQLVDMIKVTSELDCVEVFIGGGGIKMKEIKKIAKKYRHVKVEGYVPYNNLVKRYWQSDCIYVVYPPTNQAIKYSVPMKIFEAMACGIPVIANSEGYTGTFVKGNNVGRCIDEGDLQQIRKAIISLRDDPILRNKLGENGRKLIEEVYNWENMEKRLLYVYGESFIQFKNSPF